VVEFGSRVIETADVECDTNLRMYFPNVEYIGCDIQEGRGVDRIDSWGKCLTFADFSIGTLLAIGTLEHVADPWQAMRQSYNVLQPQGVMLIATHFDFPLHHLPDYWRVSPQGMEKLLGRFERRVYFQGSIAMPHAIIGVASKSKEVLDQVSGYIEQHLCEIPALFEGDMIYKWIDEKTYNELRRLEPSLVYKLTPTGWVGKAEDGDKRATER
jgi:SAM-dependent methyltransferase